MIDLCIVSEGKPRYGLLHRSGAIEEPAVCSVQERRKEAVRCSRCCTCWEESKGSRLVVEPSLRSAVSALVKQEACQFRQAS